MIALDHTTLRAHVLNEYGGAEGLGAVSKGSVQTLPDTNNVLVGWGSEPHITEYLEDGTLVFHASISGGGDTYRVFKHDDWVGNPTDPPALWTYARTTRDDSPTAFYVSWNGATEVQTWNFYVGTDREETPGSFVLAGSKDRSGFETAFSLPTYCPWAFAEAVAGNGTSLGNSSVVSPWTPRGTLAEECDDWRCPERVADFPVTYNLLPDTEGPRSSFYDGSGGPIRSAPSTGLFSMDSTVAMAALIVCSGILSIAVLCRVFAGGDNGGQGNYDYKEMVTR